MDLTIEVDTAMSHLDPISGSQRVMEFTIRNDTLSFETSDIDTNHLAPADTVTTQLLITFRPAQDSIIAFEFNENYSESASFVYSLDNYSFYVSDLGFDDTSILGLNGNHGFRMTRTFTQTNPTGQPGAETIEHDDFTASSVDLSGIFRPTHFADPSSVVEEVPPQTEALSVTSLNGSLRCSFGASGEGRLLEIYSPLGIRTASCSVSPGQTQAVIPRVAPGFYFVRLGNSLTKVFVAE